MSQPQLDFNTLVTILSLLVTLSSLWLTYYIYTKSKSERRLAEIQLGRESARLWLTSIADTLVTWKEELDTALSKGERPTTRTSKAFGEYSGGAALSLTQRFANAFKLYPRFVTQDFFRVAHHDNFLYDRDQVQQAIGILNQILDRL
jgi:hypothetical protein